MERETAFKGIFDFLEGLVDLINVNILSAKADALYVFKRA